MSRARNAIAGSLIVVLGGLFIFAKFTSFYLSQQWSAVSVPVALAVSVLPVIWIIRTVRRQNLGNPDIRSPAIRIATAVFIVPLAVTFGCWLALARALPDVFTRVAGKHFSDTHDLRTEQVTAYKECDYRVIGPPFEQGGRTTYYCASPTEFAALPEQGAMRVLGRESWFGRHIDRVENASP